jgi:hypothetical protein
MYKLAEGVSTRWFMRFGWPVAAPESAGVAAFGRTQRRAAGYDDAPSHRTTAAQLFARSDLISRPACASI